jgi:outer membrane scaffolding protein for murein synthesis (MipA/OmpV family)
MRQLWRGLLLSFLVLLVPRAGHAEDADSPGIKGTLALGVGLIPDYEGSSTYKATPYAEARVNLGNYYARFEGGSFRVNLIDSDTFHAGPLIGLRQSRGDVGSNAVAAMDHLSFSATAGGFLEYEHVAQDPRSAERATLTFDDGIAGETGGWTVTVRGVIRRPLDFIDRGLIAAVEADGSWASDRYMQTYFGVSLPDALASGLPPFRAGSGTKSVGVALSLDQFLSRKWSIGARFHYARLANDAADSPITAIAGSPNQFFAGLVIGYVL